MTKRYRHSANLNQPQHRLEGIPLNERTTTGQLRKERTSTASRLLALIHSQQRYFACLMLVYDVVIHTGDWEIRRLARAVVRGKKNPAL